MKAFLLAALTCIAMNTAWADPAPCPPGDAAAQGDWLGRVAGALRSGQLPVLAIGAGAMPDRMADALRATRPGLRVDLTAIGHPGEPAETAVPAMQAELARRKVRLVLWQTGTTEAIRNVSPADFYDSLVDGAAIASAAGADLVLIDPQYSRFLRANTDLTPYEDMLRQAALLPGVALFPRQALMHDWAEDDNLDLEGAGTARPRIRAVLHRCLGRALARMLTGGAQTVP